jgi:hypothetical protein
VTYHCMRVYVLLSSSSEKGLNLRPATADARLITTTNTTWVLVSGMNSSPMQEISTSRTFSTPS